MFDMIKMAKDYWAAEETECQARRAELTERFTIMAFRALLEPCPGATATIKKIGVEIEEMKVRERQIMEAKAQLIAAERR